MAVTQANVNTVLAGAEGGTAATGTITVTTSQVPSNNDTITVNGTVVTFKTSGAVGNQINIAGSDVLNAAAINTFLNASTDANISKAVYTVSSNAVTVTYKVPGTVGNAFTLAKSGTNLAVSAATLTGGSNSGTTEFSPTGTTLGLVDEANQDNSYEKTVLAIVAAVEFAVNNSADPSVNNLQARQQRKLLKSVLAYMTSCISPAASAVDDRATISAHIKTKTLKKYNKLDARSGS